MTVPMATVPWEVAFSTRSRARNAAFAAENRPIEDVVRPGLLGIVNDTRQSIALARGAFATSDQMTRLIRTLEQYCEVSRWPRPAPVPLAPPPPMFSGPGAHRAARINAEAYRRSRRAEQRRRQLRHEASAAVRALASLSLEHLALEEEQLAIAYARIAIFEETFWASLIRPVDSRDVDFLAIVEQELPIARMPRFSGLDERIIADALTALGLGPRRHPGPEPIRPGRPAA